MVLDNIENKTMIVYMNGIPTQAPGECGRKLPFEKCKLFTESEAEQMIEAAGYVELFFEDIFRNESVNEALRDLMEVCKDIYGPDQIKKLRVKRHMRSYILEADIFIKHWERYMCRKGEVFKKLFKDVTNTIYDENEAYALLCILRNYLVHSDDIIHGVHIGMDGFKIWADRDVLLRDIEWSRAKRELLNKQEKQIDLLKIVLKSLDALNEIHDRLLKSIITEELKRKCEFLVNMSERIVLFRPMNWYAVRATGQEQIDGASISGVGMDYCKLNWGGYKIVHDMMIKKLCDHNTSPPEYEVKN